MHERIPFQLHAVAITDVLFSEERRIVRKTETALRRLPRTVETRA